MSDIGAMESGDTIQLLFDEEGICAHGDTIASSNASYSCGDSEGETHTEARRSILQHFEETNARIREVVATKEEALWLVFGEKFAANQKLWLPHHRNSLVSAFYMLKDGTLQNLDTSMPQILSYILCHPSPATNSSSHTVPLSKNMRNCIRILKNNVEHELTSMKKHIERDDHQEFVQYSKM